MNPDQARLDAAPGPPGPVVVPGREAGFYVTRVDDGAFLWREAKRCFRLAADAADPVAAERLACLGTEFAVMAVSLLSDLAGAARALDPDRRPGR